MVYAGANWWYTGSLLFFLAREIAQGGVMVVRPLTVPRSMMRACGLDIHVRTVRRTMRLS